MPARLRCFSHSTLYMAVQHAPRSWSCQHGSTRVSAGESRQATHTGGGSGEAGGGEANGGEVGDEEAGGEETSDEECSDEETSSGSEACAGRDNDAAFSYGCCRRHREPGLRCMLPLSV